MTPSAAVPHRKPLPFPRVHPAKTTCRWNFWARTGPYLIIDAAFSLVMAYFTWKQTWHPIAALVSAILLFWLWFAGCLLNAMLVYSNEYSFQQMDEWRRIGYGEAGLQAAIAACYLAMMGFAAKAVHEWRRNRARGSGADRRVDELVLEEREEGKRMGESEFVQRGDEGRGRPVV
jgi:hypothetical protein